MKKVTLTYERETANTVWYALSNEPKSDDFNAYRSYVENEVSSVETSLQTSNSVTVDLYFAEDKYPQFETLYESIQSEIGAYNTTNNIVITKTVTDV